MSLFLRRLARLDGRRLLLHLLLLVGAGVALPAGPVLDAGLLAGLALHPRHGHLQGERSTRGRSRPRGRLRDSFHAWWTSYSRFLLSPRPWARSWHMRQSHRTRAAALWFG